MDIMALHFSHLALTSQPPLRIVHIRILAIHLGVPLTDAGVDGHLRGLGDIAAIGKREAALRRVSRYDGGCGRREAHGFFDAGGEVREGEGIVVRDHREGWACGSIGIDLRDERFVAARCVEEVEEDPAEGGGGSIGASKHDHEKLGFDFIEGKGRGGVLGIQEAM
jgi:hypothetical protein